jgi:hypothetical protein
VQHNGAMKRVDGEQLLALHGATSARINRPGLQRDDFVPRRLELQHTELTQFRHQQQQVTVKRAWPKQRHCRHGGVHGHDEKWNNIFII